MNEKLVNVFEEITSVRKFHKKLNKFFTEIREKIVCAPLIQTAD